MHRHQTTEPSAPPGRPGAKLGVWELLIVASLGAAYTARWAIRVGEGISWDQQNYQHYGAYALLSGRLDYDLAPASFQTWLNPLLYVPNYWLVNHLPPVAAGGVMAAVQGLNFVLLYALARMIFNSTTRWLSIAIALLSGVVGMSDPFLFSQLGTTDSDYLVSLPVLSAVCCICWAVGSDPPEKRKCLAVGTAGVLLGIAAGLKWTCFVYVVGMTVAILALWRSLQMDLRRFVFYGAGGVAGFLATGGFWSWHLWEQYRNPIFPYWNNWFNSPWNVPSDFRDERFLPQSFNAAVSYPFQWLLGQHPTSESPFRDARFAILTVLVAVAAAVAIARWVERTGGFSEQIRGSETDASRTQLALLLLFSVVSYLVWLRLFAIQRYLSPLTLLSGMLILVVLEYLLRSRNASLAAFVLLASFCLYWMRTEPKYWRRPYGPDWFGIKLAPEAQLPDTLFVMLGGGPMGYVVPFLPATARTVRLINSTIPRDADTELVRRAGEIISQHRGPIRSLAVEPLGEDDFAYLRRFRLTLDQSECKKFESIMDQFTTCPITRQNAPITEDKSP
ncbi:MAG: hypothetical protein HY316_06455 [Acidobacteria bacterium]|nr:hypothetical protein [Acidobacteriota bacterium]